LRLAVFGELLAVIDALLAVVDELLSLVDELQAPDWKYGHKAECVA